MRIDYFKVLDAIAQGMNFAELFRSKNSGRERLELALEKADDFIVIGEGLIGKDLIYEAKVRPLAEAYIAMGIKLSKALEEAKALRVTAPPPAA
jgi:hypothetical protein